MREDPIKALSDVKRAGLDLGVAMAPAFRRCTEQLRSAAAAAIVASDDFVEEARSRQWIGREDPQTEAVRTMRFMLATIRTARCLDPDDLERLQNRVEELVDELHC